MIKRKSNLLPPLFCQNRISGYLFTEYMARFSAEIYFNPNLVRFKRPSSTPLLVVICDFNPNLVRFKREPQSIPGIPSIISILI